MKRTSRVGESLDGGSFGLITYRDSPSGRVTFSGIVKLRGFRLAGPGVVRPGNKLATEWLLKLLKHKSRKLVAVALANKMARTAWAVMTHPWRGYRHQPPDKLRREPRFVPQRFRSFHGAQPPRKLRWTNAGVFGVDERY
jgi:hypothetical protein